MSDNKEMLEVAVAQFLMPDGRRIEKATNVPLQYKDAYEAMKRAGYELQAEMLMTREISLTISDDESDIDIQVVPNGPTVQVAICKLLENRLWENAKEIA